MHNVTPLEVVLRRDRTIVLAGLTCVAALAWAYTLSLARHMRGMDMGSMPMGLGMSMPQMHAWGAVDFVLTFVMWAVMMVAMMVPTAAPMILVFSTVSRQRRAQHRPFVPASVFLLGYIKALEPTPNSFRSCVASAIGRGSPRALSNQWC
jgi:predicted metal-binding membrane protein